MDYKERSKIIRRISFGKIKANIDFNCNTYQVEINDPDQSLLYDADFQYEKSYKNAISNGLMTHEESMELLITEGLWSSQHDIELSRINSEIQTLKNSLPSLKYKKTNFKQVASAIAELKKQKNDLSIIKSKYQPVTAEYTAECIKRKYIILNSIAYISCTGLLNNSSFINHLTVQYYTDFCPNVEIVREVARCDPWRLFWLSAKETNMELFNNSATNMTELQHALILWSRIYDFAYNSSNPPDDSVIDDDSEFDKWYEDEIRSIKEESKKGQLNNKYNDTSGSSEVFVPADRLGSKDVYELNDKQTLSKLKKRSETIDTKGRVAEFDLPDVKQRVIMEKNRQMSKDTRERV